MRRTLIVLVVGLLVVGCLTPEEKALTLIPKEQKALWDSVVGEYEFKEEDGSIWLCRCLENGVIERYYNGKEIGEKWTWTISNGEFHDIDEDGIIGVGRINKDKSVTLIAIIEDGKREDLSKDEQYTWKKIK